MKVSDYIIDFLEERGVLRIYVLPGGGAMHLNDALSRSTRIKTVACLHEQTAVVAASGEAQFSNELGVAMVTTGPGSTNSMTGVWGAWVESAPLLVLAGQVKTADINPGGLRMSGFQEVDAVSMAACIAKFATTLWDKDDVRRVMEEAYHAATTGRKGPVWVSVPLDVQAQEVDADKLEGFVPGLDAHPDEAEHVAQDVRKVLDALAGAKRPVVLAGGGVRASGAVDLFRRVAQWLGAPVLLTYKAADLLPSAHPLCAGRPGTVALRGANFAQQNADFVLAVGARLDCGQTGYAADKFAPKAWKCVVDVDPAEVGKFKFPVDLAVCADSFTFFSETLRQLESINQLRRFLHKWEPWRARCAAWKAKYPPAWTEQRGCVSAYALYADLARLSSPSDVIVPGSSGGCSEVACQSYEVKGEQRFVNSPSAGAMGFGLPHALGVALASGRRVVCVVGDGGFHLGVQALATIAQLRLPVKIFVLDNRGYASMRATQRAHFGGRMFCSGPESGLYLPDACAVASAYGLPSSTVRHHAALRSHVTAALESPGPCVVKVVADPDEEPQPRCKSAVGPHGSMVSAPLEDIWPLLPRAELAANME